MSTMTAATLDRPTTIMFSSGYDGLTPKCTWGKGDGGKKTLSVTDVPVFRSGTFADSMGIIRTWDAFQMSTMVSNFNYLKNNGTFPNIPIRKGHGSFLGDPMDSLIGWHTNVTAKEMQSPVDGQTYTYIIADLNIFDQAAAENVEAGNWPNRSAEIGSYINNAETEYFPVYLGFAYVDIPAVEGLNFAKTALAESKKNKKRFSILVSNPKEFGMADNNELPDPLDAGTGTPAAVPAPEKVVHGAPVNQHVFSVGGQPTSDFAAVQKHITDLETFKRETATAGRANFISGLASGETPRILQAQVTELQELVSDFSDAQFAKFKASYEKLPVLSLTAQHGADAGNGSGTDNSSGGAVDARTARIKDLRDIVAHHENGGIMKPEQIRATASYLELQTLLAAENK